MSRLHKGIAAFFLLWLLVGVSLHFYKKDFPNPYFVHFVVPLIGLLGITVLRNGLIALLTLFSVGFLVIFFSSLLVQYDDNNPFMLSVYALGKTITGIQNFGILWFFVIWFVISGLLFILMYDRNQELAKDREEETKRQEEAIQAATLFYQEQQIPVTPSNQPLCTDFKIQKQEKRYNVIVKISSNIHIGKVLSVEQYLSTKQSPQDFLFCVLTKTRKGNTFQEFLWNEQRKQWLSTQGNKLCFKEVIQAEFKIEKDTPPKTDNNGQVGESTPTPPVA